MVAGDRTGAIGLTPDHPVFTQDRGWVEAGLLAVGDMVRSHDGQWVAVEGSEADDRSVVVYNLTVSKYHSFFVGGPAWGFSVWVHNQNICEELQSLAVLAADPSKKAAFEAQAAKLKKRLEDAKANPSAAASQKDLEDFENIVKLTKKDGAARAAINKAGIDPNAYKAPAREVTSTIRHRHGSQTVTIGNESWHLPKGKTAADIPLRDTVGDRLEALARQHAQQWDASKLTRAQRAAIQEQIAKGRPWVGKIYEARYRGSWIEDQVRASAQKEMPHLQWYEKGVDVVDPQTGLKYEILSGSVGNLTEHAQRMKDVLFRMVTFPTR